jgi:hypothetical protein
VYPAKKDWWVLVLLGPVSLFLFGAGALALSQVAAGDVPPLPGLLLTAVLSGTGALLLSLILAASYEITESDVVARLGPIWWRIPLAGIEEVVSTRGFQIVFGLGLALSWGMLHIKYRKRNGRRAFPVSISPRDKGEFVRELAGAVPGLKVVGDVE